MMMNTIRSGLLLFVFFTSAVIAAEDKTYTGTWKGRGTKPEGDPIQFTLEDDGTITGSADLSFGKCKVGGQITEVDEVTGKLKGKLTFDGTEFPFVDMRLSCPGEDKKRNKISGTTNLEFTLNVSGGGAAKPAKKEVDRTKKAANSEAGAKDGTSTSAK
jgi:hypothetical protein